MSDKTPKRPRAPGAHKANPLGSKYARRPKMAVGGELMGPDLRSNIGYNMRRIRRELNLTLMEMSERVGFNVSYIGTLERAQQNITVDSLSNLSVAYGLTVADILSRPEPGTTPEKPLTMGELARLTRTVNDRVQELLVVKGDVSVSKDLLATVLGALVDALVSPTKYRSA